jgi:hypothetical protein
MLVVTVLWRRAGKVTGIRVRPSFSDWARLGVSRWPTQNAQNLGSLLSSRVWRRSRQQAFSDPGGSRGNLAPQRALVASHLCLSENAGSVPNPKTDARKFETLL